MSILNADFHHGLLVCPKSNHGPARMVCGLDAIRDQEPDGAIIGFEAAGVGWHAPRKGDSDERPKRASGVAAQLYHCGTFVSVFQTHTPGGRGVTAWRRSRPAAQSGPRAGVMGEGWPKGWPDRGSNSDALRSLVWASAALTLLGPSFPPGAVPYIPDRSRRSCRTLPGVPTSHPR